MKNEILKFANKEKMATGVIAHTSKKFGMKPMYIRTGFVVATLVNPWLFVPIYGAGYAYKKFKK